MKTLCIFMQYKKTEMMSFEIKKPIYFQYFILPSMSESWHKILLKDPPKHKFKSELGNPIIAVLNLKN